jgi:8-oxo-dGTP pyrophosphatase MutT (NUDIX family)
VKRTREVLIVLRRGGRVLVAHRSPDQGGYWHQIAGGVEPGETDAEAAARELAEETGLRADVGAPRHAFVYGDVTVTCFLVDVAAGWEPSLDDEHVEHRWCTLAEARTLMRYPDAWDAVNRLASQ